MVPYRGLLSDYENPSREQETPLTKNSSQNQYSMEIAELQKNLCFYYNQAVNKYKLVMVLCWC